jgi:hypothetical protein
VPSLVRGSGVLVVGAVLALAGFQAALIGPAQAKDDDGSTSTTTVRSETDDHGGNRGPGGGTTTQAVTTTTTVQAATAPQPAPAQSPAAPAPAGADTRAPAVRPTPAAAPRRTRALPARRAQVEHRTTRAARPGQKSNSRAASAERKPVADPVTKGPSRTFAFLGPVDQVARWVAYAVLGGALIVGLLLLAGARARRRVLKL